MMASADMGKEFTSERTGRMVTMVMTSGGRRQVVARADQGAGQQFLAPVFDGRWLVFGLGHSLQNPHSWTLHAWDTRLGGKLLTLADNRKGIPSPWLQPVAEDGLVAWSQGTPGKTSELHVYDLAARTDRIVYRGIADSVTIHAGLLVFLAGYEARDSEVQALGLRTGQPSSLPDPLHGLRAAKIAGSADGLTWISGDGRALLAWRQGWPAQRTVHAATDGGPLEWPSLSGDLVTWGDGDAHYVADLRSGSSVQITQQYGSSRMAGSLLIVGYMPTGNKDDPAYTGTITRVADLPPLPPCKPGIATRKPTAEPGAERTLPPGPM